MAGEKVLIVAGGALEGWEELVDAVREADLVVAVDGGLSHLERAGFTAHLLLGDLDSLEGDVPEGTEVIRFPREKDATDLELALDYVASRGPRVVRVFGVFGRRIDHTLANANLLERYDFPIVLHHGRERIHLVRDVLLLEAEIGDRVSLIPLSSVVKGITTHGLKYALKGGSLERASTRGISNEVVSTPCGVEVEEGKLLVVHAPKGGELL